MSRIAARAREIAKHRMMLAELFHALGCVFPLGYSNLWDRKGVAV